MSPSRHTGPATPGRHGPPPRFLWASCRTFARPALSRVLGLGRCQIDTTRRFGALDTASPRTNVAAHAFRWRETRPKPGEVTLWQEGQSPERPVPVTARRWSPQPGLDPPPIVWQGRPNDVAMLLEAAPVRSAVRHEQPRGHRSRSPVAPGSDLWRQPNLPIERPEHLRDIDDLGLELDHEKRASQGMPGEGIDDAPLAVDREGRLRRQLPAADVREPPRKRLVERAMPRVHDPIQVATPPPKRVVRPAVERLRDGANLPHRHAIGETTFDPRDVSLRDSSPCCQLGLRPVSTDPEGSKRGSQAIGIHLPSMPATHWPAITRHPGRISARM